MKSLAIFFHHFKISSEPKKVVLIIRRFNHLAGHDRGYNYSSETKLMPTSISSVSALILLSIFRVQ